MVDEKKPAGSRSVIDLQAARKKPRGGKRGYDDENAPTTRESESGQHRPGRDSRAPAPRRRSTDPPREEPARPSSVDEAAAAEHESGGALEQARVDVEGSEGLDALESTGADDRREPAPLDELDVADAEVVVEFEEPDVRPLKKVKKGKKPKEYAGDDRRQRSDQEVLARLLEKNELILQLSKKNVRLEAQAKATEDRRLRVAAEFENYRKRTRKEWELLKQQTTAEVILEILDVVDDFERAFTVAGNRSDDFVQGIRLIYNNMMSVLVKFGVLKMKALHVRFDPTFHMAVANLDSKDVESNHVVEVIQDGYLLGDTVIRPAKVVIAK